MIDNYKFVLDDIENGFLEIDEDARRHRFYLLCFAVLETAFSVKGLDHDSVVKKNILKMVYPDIYNNNLYVINTSFDFVTDTVGELNEYDLIKFYEIILENKAQKEFGQFNTSNSKLIDYMLDLTGYDAENMENWKILEPSVGSGLFLIKILERFLPYLEKQQRCSADILTIVCDNLFAIDIDEMACFLSEVVVLLKLKKHILNAYETDNSFKLEKLNIMTGDFTKVPYAYQNKLFEKKELSMPELNKLKLKKEKYRDGFDLIIGNPPYITMYGKRSKNMTSEKRIYFNNNYDFVVDRNRNNKFNTIMFFIERSLKAINDGQLIAFILDIAFFETAYKDIRKYILENAKIKYIIKGFSDFENVISGQFILILEKCSDQDGRDSNHTIWVEKFERIEFKQNQFKDKHNEYKFLKPLRKREKEIILSMEENGKKLVEIFPRKQLRTCCALTGKTEEFMVSEQAYFNNKEGLIFRYLEGSKGLKEKFGDLFHTRYFKYDYDLQQEISEQFKRELTNRGVKNKKRIALGDLECYRSPKIFIRQSAKELIATYTEEEYAANNSLYLLSNKKNSTENKSLLKYVCVLLNSDLLTFYAQKRRIIRYEMGKTPQIKIGDLKKLPLLINDRYISLFSDYIDSRNKDLKMINQIVYDIYSIDKQDIPMIKQSIELYKKGIV